MQAKIEPKAPHKYHWAAAFPGVRAGLNNAETHFEPNNWQPEV